MKASTSFFWWEKRRILYNVIILITGTVTIWAISVVAEVPPNEDIIEPVAVIVFLTGANIMYFSGWIIHVGTNLSESGARGLFKAGVIFTVILIFVPLFLNMFLF